MREHVDITGEQALQEVELTTQVVISKLRSHGWSAKTFGAAFGLCGGIVAAIAACALTVVCWVTHRTWHGPLLQRSCTVLFFLMIPLLIFGAHCLDLLDSQEKGTRQ